MNERTASELIKQKTGYSFVVSAPGSHLVHVELKQDLMFHTNTTFHHEMEGGMLQALGPWLTAQGAATFLVVLFVMP